MLRKNWEGPRTHGSPERLVLLGAKLCRQEDLRRSTFIEKEEYLKNGLRSVELIIVNDRT